MMTKCVTDRQTDMTNKYKPTFEVGHIIIYEHNLDLIS